MSAKPGQSFLAADLVIAFVAKVLRPLLWDRPKDWSIWFWQTLFDQPRRVLVYSSPVLLPVAVVALVWGCVAAGISGELVKSAWNNEEVSRKNVETAKKFLREHEGEKPERVYDWQKRSYGAAWYDARHLKRLEWEAQEERAKKVRDDSRAKVPSMFSFFPPRQAFPEAGWDWSLFYDAHHLIFRSLYPRLLLLYLLLGIGAGWKRSRLRARLKWKSAFSEHTPSHILLGLDNDGRGYFVDEAKRSQHLLVVGATGFGKSEALKHLVRMDIRGGLGTLFIDLKGDRQMAHELFDECVRYGRGNDFRHFTLEGPSSRYNPLRTGSAGTKQDRVMKSFVWGREEFYNNAAKATLGLVLAAFARRTQTEGGTGTFSDLYLAVSDKDAYGLVAAWAAPDDTGKFKNDLENWNEFLRTITGLRDNLSEFTGEGLKERLCDESADIVLEEAHQKNLVVYFELNSQLRSMLAPSLARFILEDVKALAGTIGMHPERKKPFHVYIDEAGRAVYKGLGDVISLCRSAGIGLTLSTQSPFDFDQPADAPVMTSILQNTATKIIFQQPAHESAELCAKLGGTQAVKLHTRQLVDEGLLLGVNASGVMSEREGREFFVHPDTIKDLPVGTAFFIRHQTRTVIDLPYSPPRTLVAFTPVRESRPSSPKEPSLNLASLVEKEREKIRGEGPKIRTDKGKKTVPPATQEKPEDPDPADRATKTKASRVARRSSNQ